MLARLHVIIASEADKDIEMIKQLLLNIDPEFSISPARQYQGLKDHSEFYCTCDLLYNINVMGLIRKCFMS